MTIDARVKRVRFGGRQTAHGFLFELSGGRLCLDFANTLDERRTVQPRERIPDYERLLEWGTQASAISSADAAICLHHAARRPRLAARVLESAVEIREAIFRLFSAAAGRRPLPPDALTKLNAVLPRALAARYVKRRGGGAAWGWRRPEHASLSFVLAPVVLSAAELLTSPDLRRVRECAGATCRWLFIDASRNGTRRWCDMSVCGNRAKARRHRARASARV